MKIISSTLIRVFAKTFYQVHAPIFLFVIGICFGFMSGIEHKAMAVFFVSSPIFISIPVVVWAAYTAKVIHFNRLTLHLDRNAFVFNITLLGLSAQLQAFCILLIIQLLPIVAYAVFLMTIAIQLQKILSLIIIPSSIVILLMGAVIAFSLSLKINTRKKSVFNFLRLFKIRYPRFYTMCCVEWIVREDLVTFFVTKIFGCMILLGITKLYQADHYDWRLLIIGLTITFSLNVNALLQLHRFENSAFQLTRNLPWSIAKRFLNNALVIMCLALPEWGILVRNYPGNLSFTTAALSVLFGLSLHLLFYALLYATANDDTRFTRIAFAAAIGEIVITLFTFPLWIMVMINLATGLVLFKRFFYRYEHASPN